MRTKSDELKKIPRITFLSAMVCTKTITDAISEIYADHGEHFKVQIIFVNDINTEIISAQEFSSQIFDTDIMLIDIRGNCRAVELLVSTYKDMENDHPELFKRKTIISLVGGNEEIRSLTKMGSFEAKNIPSKKLDPLEIDEVPDLTDLVKKGIKISQNFAKIGKILPVGMFKHLRNWTMTMDYWTYGHSGVPDNLKQLLLFLLKEYLNFKNISVKPPLKIPAFGIYDPLINQYFSNIEDYKTVKNFDDQKQTIGIFYYGGIYFEQTQPILSSFMKNLSQYNIIPLYSETLNNLKAQKQFFFIDNICLVSAVINLQYFQINGGPFGGDNSQTLQLYQEMNVPQFNPIINFDMSLTDYSKSSQGIIPINQVIAIIMPELDGRIEMLTTGLMDDLGYSDEIGASVLDIIPLEKTIALLSKRIDKWMKLRLKSNSQKKIALIIYDYPPGEANLGNAAYLDVSESVKKIIQILRKEDYQVKSYPEDQILNDLFINAGCINTPEYLNLTQFKGIRVTLDDLKKYFYSLPEQLRDQMVTSWGEFPGDIMVYQQEILLPILSFGNILIGLQPARGRFLNEEGEYHNKQLPPHYQYLAFYKYLEMTQQVDAIIHVGTHGTEEFLPGKECAGSISDFNINLLGSIPNIYFYHITNTSEAAIAKRRGNAVILNHSNPPFDIAGLNPEYDKLAQLVQDFIEKNNDHNNNDSISESQVEMDEINSLSSRLNLPFISLEDLQLKLYRYKMSTIPNGLHIIGQNYSPPEICEYLLNLLLHSDTISPNVLKFFDLWGKNDEERIFSLKPYLLQIVERIFEEIDSTIDLPPEIMNNSSYDNLLFLDFSIWVRNLTSKINESRELENMLCLLDGGYLEPGYGGDPIRNPEIFPTGRNSYGFDPRLIPSKLAYKKGDQIAESLLHHHFDVHNEWPSSVGLVLWGFETMKTGGETIGQIFNYLGVRTVKNKSVWTTELEIIPLEEMSHPRINVLITICGIFRDIFPYLLDLINRAVEMVENLDEPFESNFIKKNLEDLKNEDVENPHARVFGPPPGKYNTNLTDMISSSKWDSEKDLAQDYINNMGYAYLKNNEVQDVRSSFQSNLKNINYISQIRDSTEYHITDLDHYYEFLGGMARAHEEVSNQKIDVLVADTSTKNLSISSLSESINEGAITRNLNETWINGMLKHKRHGGKKIAERMENLLGMSATAHSVENWLWEEAYQKYIKNENIRDQLIENNRFAMMDMIKTMLEANQRNYWDTSDENILNLKKLFLNLEQWIEKTFA